MKSEDEDDYLLVKRLCQLMVQIGTCQIIPLVVSVHSYMYLLYCMYMLHVDAFLASKTVRMHVMCKAAK